MHSYCTARVQTPNTGYATMEMFVYILPMFMFLPVYLALDVGSTAQVPLRPRLRTWRPPPGSGLASHDSPPLSPTAGWVQLMSSRCSVQNAGNSESGSTSAGASARGPLEAVTMCWAGLSIKPYNTKKIIKYWRGNTCSSDISTKELPAIRVTGKVEHGFLSF